MMDLVEEFEKEIREEKIRRVQMRQEEGKEWVLNLEAEIFRRSYWESIQQRFCLGRMIGNLKMSIWRS